MGPPVKTIEENRSAAVRFGLFEFNTITRALSKSGVLLKLQDQPALVLAALLRDPGRVVSREDLHRELWPADTFVEFEAGLNSAVRKLRRVLGDTAESPLYIETIPRQGYRFIAPVTAVEMAATAVVAATPSEPKSHRLIAVATVVVVCIAAAAWLFGSVERPQRSTAAVPTRLTLDLPAGHEVVPPGGGVSVAIDREGRWVAWISHVRGVPMIYRRSLSDSRVTAVPGTEGATTLAISPDGQWITFATREAVKEVSVDRQEIREIAPGQARFSSVWAPDGSLYFTSSPAASETLPGPISVMDRARRIAQPITTKTTSSPFAEYHFAQQLLPANALLYTVVSSPVRRSIAIRSLASGEQRVLLDQAMGGQYLPTGHLLYHWADKLFAAAFDPETLKVQGRGTVVLENVARAGWSGAQASFSDNGTLVYLAAPAREMRELVWVDEKGNETPLQVPQAEYLPLDASSDGNRVLVARQDSIEHWTIWICDLRTQRWKKIGGESITHVAGVFSPDGRKVAIAGKPSENAEFGISIIDADSNTVEFIETTYGAHPQHWSQAHNALVLTTNGPVQQGLESTMLALSADRKFSLLAGGNRHQAHASVSRDGRWVAYSQTERAGVHVWLRPFHGGTPVRVSGAEGGTAPIWSPDARTLYYRAGQTMMAIPVSSSGQPGTPRALFQGDYAGTTGWVRGWALSSDGKRFLLARPIERPSQAAKLHVVINWFAEVEQLAGVARR